MIIMENKRDTTTLSVHRCRFVDYAPSAITALAFPLLPLPSLKGKKKTTAEKQSFKFGLLAVGHANGNIDICEWMGAERQIQCSQAWVVRKVCCTSCIFISHRVSTIQKFCS
jgi:U3 small nucleolar RNA-associated protein 4